MDYNKILKDLRVPDNLICLLRNLCVSQEATISIICVTTTDWFKIRKGVHRCTLSPCLFNLYAKYIMGNAMLDEAQGGINIPRRNINSFRYEANTTLIVESKGPLDEGERRE